MRRAQCIQQCRRRGLGRVTPGRHHDGVCGGQHFQPMRDIDAETGRGLQRAGLGGTDAQRVTRCAQSGQVFTEDHARHGQMERADLLVGDHGDVVSGGWHQHGPILAMIGIWATVGRIRP
ncbi:hypothetical protein D3C81_1355510 [compost metagenome]